MSDQFEPSSGGSGQNSGSGEIYVAPEIQTYSPEEFLNLLGPAQGYGGGGPGSERGIGRGFRLFPALR